jgi:hypothetical protein
LTFRSSGWSRSLIKWSLAAIPAIIGAAILYVLLFALIAGIVGNIVSLINGLLGVLGVLIPPPA